MQRLAQWHKAGLGLLVFAGAELAVAYGFASLAIDSGNLWYYLLTLIFLFGFLHNTGKLALAIGKGLRTMH